MRRDATRKLDYWRYAFNKYAMSIEHAPADIRRSWSIAAIQHNAAEFATAVVKAYGNNKPPIRFDRMGVPIINGQEFKW